MRIALGAAGVTLGRSEQAPGNLGADPHLADQHARIQLLDGRILIEDLRSSAGTAVNGRPIPAPTLLQPGDEIALGSSRLRVVAAPQGAAGQVAAAPGAPAAAGPGAPPQAPPPRPKRRALRVVAGAAPGAMIPLGEGATTVGASVPALAGDSQLADQHLKLSPLPDGRVLIEDLGSQSGTWIGSNRIPGPTVIGAGERFQIGGTIVEVVEGTGIQGGAGTAPQRAVGLGGVQTVPQGLFQLIGARAPVTRDQVLRVFVLALGWALALNLLIRTLAIEGLDVDEDANAFKLPRLILATLIPVVANSFGFFSSFRRPNDHSAKRYLIPTFLVPILFTIFVLVTLDDTSAAAVICAILITVLPIVITAFLMLRLRGQVAMGRVREVRGA